MRISFAFAFVLFGTIAWRPAGAQNAEAEVVRLLEATAAAKSAVVALHEQTMALIDDAGAELARTLREHAAASPPLRPSDLMLIRDARLLIQSDRLAAADRVHEQAWTALAQALHPEPRTLAELGRRLGPFRAALTRYRPALEALSGEAVGTPALAQELRDMVRVYAEAHDAGAALDAAVTAGDEASFVIVLRHISRVAQHRQAVTERGVALVTAAEAALARVRQRFGSPEAAEALFAELRQADTIARELARLRAATWSSLTGLDAAGPPRPAGTTGTMPADATPAGAALAAGLDDLRRMAEATAFAAIAATGAAQAVDARPHVFARRDSLVRHYRGVDARFAAATQAVASAAADNAGAIRRGGALAPGDRAALRTALERALAELHRAEKLVGEMKAKSGLSPSEQARLAGTVAMWRATLPGLAGEYRHAGPADAAAPRPRDDADVIRALTRRALAGDATAALYLAQLALIGVGGPPDAAEARGWFEKAAQAGDRRGQFILGLMFEDAGDAAAGEAWIQKAADQGLPAALTHRGLALRTSDPAAARRYLGLAAAQDYHPAYVALTEMD